MTPTRVFIILRKITSKCEHYQILHCLRLLHLRFSSIIKYSKKKKKKSKNKQNIEANTWADQKNLKPGFHPTETEKGEDVYPSNPNKLYREKKKREQTEGL